MLAAACLQAPARFLLPAKHLPPGAASAGDSDVEGPPHWTYLDDNSGMVAFAVVLKRILYERDLLVGRTRALSAKCTGSSICLTCQGRHCTFVTNGWPVAVLILLSRLCKRRIQGTSISASSCVTA